MIEALRLQLSMVLTTTTGTPRAVQDRLRHYFRTCMLLDDPWAEQGDDLKRGFLEYLKRLQDDGDSALALVDVNNINLADVKKRMQSERAAIASQVRTSLLSLGSWYPSGSPAPPSLSTERHGSGSELGSQTPNKTPSSRGKKAIKVATPAEWREFCKDVAPVIYSNMLCRRQCSYFG